MTRALLAAFRSDLRALMTRFPLADDELLDGLLGMAMERCTEIGMNDDALRFELDKRLLQRAVSKLGSAG